MDDAFVAIVVADAADAGVFLERAGGDVADALRSEAIAALRRVTAEHGGREVRSTGAGLVAAFPSAASALLAAATMQRALADALEGGLRIGVDAGEPVASDGDLYGAPVIAAGELCAASAGGEILASEAVRHIAGARIGLTIEPAGAIRVPGFRNALGVARVLWDEASLPASPDRAPRKISVLIADDQLLVRTGFRVILEAEPDIRVVGEAADGRAAVAMARSRTPDVVLMDIRMPELDGLRAAAEIIGDAELRSAVVMLTTFDIGSYVYEALRIGASGFLLKDAPAARLLDAVRVAAAGDALIEPAITRRLIEQFARSSQPRPGAVPAALSELSPRELEVLRLVARGLSNAEIAAELVLGENTVKTHVGHVLAKLGLRDRVQAVVTAYEAGLVAAELQPARTEPAG